jgi:putative membrane-bound dehydrogenase-like protein
MTHRNLTFHLAAFLWALCSEIFLQSAVAQKSQEQPAGPLSPAQALSSFRLPDDLRVELVAGEPEVIDPVAIRFDELGRLWVAEMRDYPIGPPPGGDQRSRIRVLEDRDSDGRFETATLFAEGRSFVTGLQPWKGGVIVTESGKVSYLKDEDGDGKADVDETWFTGFSEGNTQLRANHPRLGIDNFVYVANGLRGGTVVDHRDGQSKPISINGMDFRFDPHGGSAEAVSGVGQFGMAFDNWGNRFLCTNRNPVRHVVIEDRYLKASPHVTVAAVAGDVADFAEKSRVFPLTRAWTTSNLHAGQFTAACGVLVYRGDALPDPYRGNAFTCDPTGNLIHREIMQPLGPTFTSKPAYADREWLASTDEWFRPVSMELGPDGAIYVVDMYRAVIEHPEFMPDELKKRPDLRLGDDRGRIYRVTAKNGPMPDRAAIFTETDEAALLKALKSPNAWQRETAQRLLLEQNISGPQIACRLADHAPAEAQVHALHFKPNDLRLAAAMKSKDANVRRQAIVVAESRLAQSEQLHGEVARCLQDDAAIVRFQAMLSLSLDGQHDIEFLASSLQPSDSDDPWMRSAVELAAGDRSADLLKLLLAKQEPQRSRGASELLASLAARAVTHGKAATAQQIIGQLAEIKDDSTDTQRLKFLVLDAVARAGRAHGLTLGSLASTAEETDLLKAVKEAAVHVAGDAATDQADRADAIGLLAYFPDSAATLAEIIRSEPVVSLRQVAVAAIAQHDDAEVWRELVDTVAGLTPPVRRSILEAAIGPSARANLLLNAIESAALKPGELDLLQANRLRQHPDPAIRDRALKLLTADAPADRIEALERFQSALTLTGDPAKGRVLFEKNCSTCHRVGDVGVNVAPDISDSRTKTAGQLLADIIQPNRAIDNNYIAYNVLLANGTNTTGVLASESTTSITLRQPGDKTVVLARTEIEELRSSGVSLMPEGLEKNLDPQSMADLLAYLKNWRYLDGKTPLGN